MENKTHSGLKKSSYFRVKRLERLLLTLHVVWPNSFIIGVLHLLVKILEDREGDISLISDQSCDQSCDQLR